MRFCIKKVKISPAFNVFLSGFGDRTHKSEGVLDDIYVKAVLIEANKNLLVLALDSTSGDRSFVDDIKQALCRRFKLSENEIIINFSHSHSSISISEERLDSDENIQYYNDLKEKILTVVGSCFDNLQEGEIQLGKGISGIGVSRRKIVKDEVLWAPDFSAIIDKEVPVFKFVDEKGSLKGVVFSCSCHPSSLGPSNYLLSADYPGYACKYIEEKFEACEAVFLQGCGAEIKPKGSVNEAKTQFKDCTYEEVREIGKALGMEVENILRGGNFKKIDVNIRAQLKDTKLYTEVKDVEFFKEKLAVLPQNTLMYNKLAEIIRTIEEGEPKSSIPFYVCLVELDKHGTNIIGLEGEILSTTGIRIKDLFKSLGLNDTLVLGYTNGVQTYIPNEEVLKQGGYERDVYMFRGLSGPFKSDTEELICENLLACKDSKENIGE